MEVQQPLPSIISTNINKAILYFLMLYFLMLLFCTEGNEDDAEQFQTKSLADAMEDFNLADHQEWTPHGTSK